MQPEDLVEALRQRPFEPFRIHLFEAVVYEIRHPDQVWVGLSKAVIVTPKHNYPFTGRDRHETVALWHITRLTPLASPVTGNGS